MRDALTDGRLQVTAALALLDQSRLVEWVPETATFCPVAREAFEFSWRRDMDPVFGRLLCWILFAAGAEFLAKGTCLVRGVEIRTTFAVPVYPTTDIEGWVPRFRKSWKCDGTVDATHFGTLGSLTHDDFKLDVQAALSRLCSAVSATSSEKDLLLAAYELLRRSIRNRDAHAYVPNVRDSHFNLIPVVFTQCFNLFVSWLPGGRSTLNEWKAGARQLVASM